MPRYGKWIEHDGQRVHVDYTAPSCAECAREAEFLCDWPDERRKSGTCDRKLCKFHAVHLPGGRQHCLSHTNVDTKQRRLL